MRLETVNRPVDLRVPVSHAVKYNIVIRTSYQRTSCTELAPEPQSGSLRSARP